MANFDPQSQEQGDNPFIYGYGARPIQQPKSDTSGEILGKAIGKGLDEAGNLVKGASHLGLAVQTADATSGMRQEYDAGTNAFINRLSQVDDVLKRSKDPEGLINNYGQYPADLKKLPGMVDQLVALRDNGHVSEAYLDMQRDDIAKRYRAKYPGMRGVIDQEFTRMTREDPANKVIAQLTQDINATAAAAKAQRDKVGNMILSSVGKGIVPFSAYQQYQNNPGAAPEIMGKIYSHAKAHLDLEDSELRTRVELQNRTLSKDKMTDRNGSDLDKLVGINASNLEMDIPGMSHAHIADVMNHIQDLDDATRIKVAQVFRMAGANFATQARNMGNKPIDPNDPNSPTRASFDTNFDKTVESKRKYFDDLAKLIMEDKVGLAYSQAQWMQATMSAKGAEAIKNIPGLAANAELAKIAPNSQYANQFFQKLVTDQQVSESMHGYVTGAGFTAVTQPELKTRGMPFTMGNALDDAGRKDIEGPPINAIISGAKWVLTNKESTPELRRNAAMFLYGDPEAITKVNTSNVEGNQVTPGKSTLLATTVNAETTNAVKRLGDPARTQEYIDYAKKSTWLTIHPEIEQLSKIAANPQFKISFDTDHNQFSVVPNLTPEQRRAGIRAPDGMKAVQDSVTKINLALRSMIDVSTKLTHESPQDFLAQFFIESGMDPQQVKDTIGGQFIEALINATKKPEPHVESIRD